MIWWRRPWQSIFAKRSISVSEAGRLGAAVTNAKRKERTLEKARQPRAECGLEPHPVLEAR